MNKNPKSLATAQDVADRAGVSRSAVSRCLSGAGKVSKAKQVRIRAAADELGYRPNAIARSLIGGKTDLVAVITAGRDSIHNMLLIERLIFVMAQRGKKALVIPANMEAGIDDSILDAADYQVDAIVVIGGTVSSKVVDRLSRFGVPIFLYERFAADPGLECVTCDNVSGGRLAARFLVRCGHQRIAYVTKSLQTFSNTGRRSGFENGLRDAGLDIFAEARGQQSFDGGFQAAIELFSAKDVPDAVFCFNDEMALGALQAASVMKMAVPDDVAIIGYDDIPQAAWSVFNLTTIHNAINQPVTILLDRMFARLSGENAQGDPHMVAPELVVRGTTL